MRLREQRATQQPGRSAVLNRPACVKVRAPDPGFARVASRASCALEPEQYEARPQNLRYFQNKNALF